jgi:hypothetical protein
MKKLLVLLCMTIAIHGALRAQTPLIKGRVVDDSTGTPIPDVSIILSGTSKGATTGPDGSFTLSFPADGKRHSLLVSYTGYGSAEGIRKFDLIRWNLLGQRLADAKTNLTSLSQRTGGFTGAYNTNPLDFSKLPDSVFYKKASFIETGINWAVSLYQPRTVSSVSGAAKVAWATKAVANVLSSTGSSNGFAFYFTPNHSELLPIPLSALQSNNNLVQDYGY